MRGKKLVDVCVNGVPKSQWANKGLSQWQDSILEKVSHQVKEEIEERVSVKLEFFLEKSRYETPNQNDTDNFIKPVFDALSIVSIGQKAVILNDYLIDDIKATKIPTDNEEKTHIQIWKWNPTQKHTA
jgi:Holliday junction resolvase RusA-like endonuclease